MRSKPLVQLKRMIVESALQMPAQQIRQQHSNACTELSQAHQFAFVHGGCRAPNPHEAVRDVELPRI